ncbi:MAG: SMC-Scp complex subunit ScpB [Oscillospiraceae bacterium]|nr:SMC-Scp complex subunit ScpB [Oscillospiraceae bacterium]
MDIKSSIEAILFAAGDSVPIARLSLILEVSENEIEKAAEELADSYVSNSSGIRLLRLDRNLQLCSAPEYAEIISKTLEQRKPAKLSQAALETLAVVAYFQPVTRSFIEQMRGVDSSYTVSVLEDRGLIEVGGRMDVPGRPLVYITTDVFLRTMGISELSALPSLPDMSSSEGMEKLQSAIDHLQNNNPQQISLNEITGQTVKE